jgi:hypothetical protein
MKRQYAKFIQNLENVWKPIGKKPNLTLAEKILYSHLSQPLEEFPTRGSSYLKLNPGKLQLITR